MSNVSKIINLYKNNEYRQTAIKLAAGFFTHCDAVDVYKIYLEFDKFDFLKIAYNIPRHVLVEISKFDMLKEYVMHNYTRGQRIDVIKYVKVHLNISLNDAINWYRDNIEH